MSKKILFVKNILAPYRIFLFNRFQEILDGKSIKFEVYVMRETEADRTWKVNRDELNFIYDIDSNGLYTFLLKKYHFHFNYRLGKKILSNNYSDIILGGSWNNINVIIIVILKRLGLIKSKVGFWTEANYLTIGSRQKNKLKYFLRKFILDTCDAYFLLPGKMAKKTLFEKWGVTPKKVIYLPNLVDTKLFTPGQKRASRISARQFLIVARLVERTKGILNFLKSIPKDGDYIIRIAGEGPDRPLIEDYICKNNLSRKIILLGNLQEEELVKEYTNADIFVLPSFSDQSPLSIVEACFMELPLFISNHCGNHYETLINGKNGFIFNPYCSNEIGTLFQKLCNLPDFELKEMGRESSTIVKHSYSPDSVFQRFLNEV